MDLFVLIAIAIGAIGLIAFLFKSNTPKSTVTQHKSIQLPESKPVNKRKLLRNSFDLFFQTYLPSMYFNIW